MFRFAAPYMLYLLLLIPVMASIYILAVRSRKRRLRSFGEQSTIYQLMPEASPRRVRNKFILYLCAVGLIIVGLARPQVGAKLKEASHTGIEIMLAVDVSNSMLARDLEPTRLDRTKYAINRLLENLHEDKVGLVVFAGDAYVQLPITSDYTAARNFVRQISPNMVSRQGTAIGAAIDLASASFSSNSEGSRVIILISDGENHEDNPLASAEAAAAKGIKIYVIGVGTPQGTFIEVAPGEYMKDENGENVVTKLDEETLEKIAFATGGAYISATSQSMGLDEIVAKINETEKSEFKVKVFDEFNEQFRYFLGIAAILLIIESIMLSRKNRILASVNIFRSSKKL